MSYQARLTRLFVLLFALLMATLLIACFFTTARAQGSTTVTVNTTSIVIDGNTNSVSALLADPGADGMISFPEALAAVNNTGAGHTINFDLPHGSLIAFNSSLDLLASNTTIDGDVGGNSTPVDVMLIYPTDSVITLRIRSNNNIIRNLAIEGLEIFGTAAYSNTVVGSYIGTNVDGQLAVPRLGNGVGIMNGSHHNIIENNIIAGNRSAVVNPQFGWSGVQIVAAHDNQVRGNHIGLNVDGDRLSNDFGVWIGNGASRNIIGGNRTSTACEGPCNVISGNNGPGIVINGSGSTISNVVKGNYVGLSVTGLISIPNVSQGIQVFAGARQNVIGGQRASDECTGPCNVISGNGQEGIRLSTDVISSVVQGNFIGVNALGTAAVPNALSGVAVLNRASQNLIGGERAPGACAGPCNLISDNASAGVWVTGQTTRGNTIRGNEIHDNGGLGIDLGGSSAPDGITLNDATDGDSGPNDLLNAPLSLAADFDGTNTFVTGVVSATNATALTIDVYGKFDPANSGEAWRYLGKTTPTADGSFQLTLPGNGVYPFPELSATVTDGDGNTSEFSLKTPAIFVPGIAGSTLVNRAQLLFDEFWLGIPQAIGCNFAPPPFDCNTFRARLSLRPQDVAGTEIAATDAIRQAFTTPVYGPFLEGLVSIGRYHEYQLNNDPIRLTAAGCDYASQKTDVPNLFVFPYDWRKSNIENASQLKDYVDCVQQFYPGARINIAAHSMGGLLARRYILQYSPNHHVQRLITLDSPWVGAPKLLYVLETGDFMPIIASGRGIKYAVESMPGAHELMPSPHWFSRGGNPPLREIGVDYNNNGRTSDIFDNYDSLANAVNARYPQFTPGTTNRQFHNDDQDFILPDHTGVRYFQLYGTQQVPRTIVQVHAIAEVSCRLSLFCTTKPAFKPVYGYGDATVPTLSHSPWGSGTYQTNDTPSRQVIQFVSQSSADDANYEHGYFQNNPAVRDKVIDLLVRSGPPNLSAMLDETGKATGAAVPPGFYTLKVNGATTVTVSDGANSTAPISNTDILGVVPGVSAYSLGEQIEEMILPATAAYSVTFRTTDEPLALELTLGDGMTVTQAVRYQDLSLPPGVTATLMTAPPEPSALSYDADGDGSFETTVTPTVSISGTLANDVLPPEITIGITDVQSPTLTVSLTAQDSGSGVQRLLYSLDGTHYQPYTSPFQANGVSTPTLYAFADDNVANRRAIVYSLADALNSHDVYLPVVRR